jgi:hypothetical protein
MFSDKESINVEHNYLLNQSKSDRQEYYDNVILLKSFINHKHLKNISKRELQLISFEIEGKQYIKSIYISNLSNHNIFHSKVTNTVGLGADPVIDKTSIRGPLTSIKILILHYSYKVNHKMNR